MTDHDAIEELLDLVESLIFETSGGRTRVIDTTFTQPARAQLAALLRDRERLEIVSNALFNYYAQTINFNESLYVGSTPPDNGTREIDKWYVNRWSESTLHWEVEGPMSFSAAIDTKRGSDKMTTLDGETHREGAGR